MAETDDQSSSDRVMLMTGNSVGLALMVAEDAPTIARWNQDLEFTARLRTPEEAHTLEMRQDAYKQNSPVKPDSAEFGVIELCTGRLVGFGGLFDITRALAATMFVGIGETGQRRKGYGTEASRLTRTIMQQYVCMSASGSNLWGACAVPICSTIAAMTRLSWTCCTTNLN
jgi:RimJ/RimL family protein N-acetyltransferase